MVKKDISLSKIHRLNLSKKLQVVDDNDIFPNYLLNASPKVLFY